LVQGQELQQEVLLPQQEALALRQEALELAQAQVLVLSQEAQRRVLALEEEVKALEGILAEVLVEVGTVAAVLDWEQARGLEWVQARAQQQEESEGQQELAQVLEFPKKKEQ